MFILNIYRQGNHTHLKETINKIYQRKGQRVCRMVVDDPEAVYESFIMVRKAYAAAPDGIQYHLFSIQSRFLIDENEFWNMVLRISDEFAHNYQLVVSVDRNEIGMEAVFLVNAVSYQDGKKYHDNNSSYIELCRRIKEITGKTCQVAIADLFAGNTDLKTAYKSYK